MEIDAEFQPGDLIAQRYRVLEILGRGGSGIMFAAQDEREGGRPVAVKQLMIRHMGGWKDLELFEREARVLASLGHPAIPRYVDYLQADAPSGPSVFLVQEIAEGQSLAAKVAGGWRPTEAEVKDVARQLLEILVYLQGLNPPVIHRDIKPHNVIRGADGTIRVVDFGAVQEAHRNTLVGGTTVVGTYGYMAPEQMRGRATGASDVYGVGATLLFLLTHKSPADLPQNRLRAEFRSKVSVSAPLVAWIERAIEPAPEDRFQSAKEALAALQQGRVAAGPADLAKRRRMTVLLAAFAGSALVALLVSNPRVLVESLAGPRTVTPAPKATPRPLPVKLDDVRDLGSIGVFGAIASIACSPDGLTVAVGSTDRSVTLWRLSTGQRVQTFPGHSDRVSAIVFSPDGRTLISAGGPTVHVWNTSTGKALGVMQGHTDRINRMALARDGTTLATASSDHTVKLWDVAKLVAKGSFDEGRRAFAVALAPSGTNVAIGRDDGSLVVRKLPTGEVTHAFKHDAAVGDVAFTPDGQMLVSASDDRTVRSWSLPDKREIAKMSGHTDEIWHLALSADGQTIVSGAGDGIVKIWDLTTAKARLTFRAGKGANTGVAFGPDGVSFLTGNMDQHVRQWDLSERETTTYGTRDVQDRPGWTPLHVAAFEGDLTQVRALLRKGTPVDIRTTHRRTPLYLAAKAGHLDVVKVLLGKGADPNAADAAGMVPLYPAAQDARFDVVKLLLDRGADATARNNVGVGLVRQAANSDIAKLLLSRGALVNDRSHRGTSALDNASQTGDVPMVRLLLAQPDIDLGVAPWDKHTPLMLAARWGHVDVVRLLLEHGAEVEAQDLWGRTALTYALFNGEDAVAKMLRQKGAKEPPREKPPGRPQ